MNKIKVAHYQNFAVKERTKNDIKSTRLGNFNHNRSAANRSVREISFLRMTIEQLAETATDGESFSLEGEVVVELETEDGKHDHVNESGERVQLISVSGAHYSKETKQLILRVARQAQGT